ncbi:MAG: glycoside hydrolase family 92 protein [Myxococcota bacterium]
MTGCSIPRPLTASTATTTGTLSAWALWATLGLYPVTGTDRYAVARPAVDHAEVETTLGTLTIDVVGDSGTVELDGAEIVGVVHHDALGGSLTFR